MSFYLFADIQNLKEEVTLKELQNLQEDLCLTSCLLENDTHQWVLTLPQGVVVNEGGILTREGYILTDVRTSLRDQHGLTRPKRDLSSENPLFFEGRLAVISSPGSENWYHWLLQVLPRLIILKESGVVYDRIYINNMREGWQKESLHSVLSFLRIPQEKLLNVEGDCILQATQLIVPSVPFIPLKGMGLPHWLVDRLRQIFFAPSPTPTILPIYEKIYISRERAHSRRIVNERELIHALEQEVIPSV